MTDNDTVERRLEGATACRPATVNELADGARQGVRPAHRARRPRLHAALRRRGPPARARLPRDAGARLSRRRAQRPTATRGSATKDEKPHRDARWPRSAASSARRCTTRSSAPASRPSLVGWFVDMFAWDINFYIDSRPATASRSSSRSSYLGGKFYKYGRVLAAEYTGRTGHLPRLLVPARRTARPAATYTEHGESIVKSAAQDAAQVRARLVGVRPPPLPPDPAHRAGAPRRRLRGADGHAGVGDRRRAASPSSGRAAARATRDHRARRAAWSRSYMHLSKFAQRARRRAAGAAEAGHRLRRHDRPGDRAAPALQRQA